MNDIEICNVAISFCGSDTSIASFTEDSTEARACNRFYEIARNDLLRGFPWPFATKQDALTQIEEDPNDEWGYSYAYPPDCLSFHRIISGVRTENEVDRVPFEVYGGKIIFCDYDDAEGEWTYIETDTAKYPVDFCIALAYHLAFFISPILTRDTKLSMNLLVLAQQFLSRARANSANEEQPDPQPESGFIDERE